jgi:hypothetical protein
MPGAADDGVSPVPEALAVKVNAYRERIPITATVGIIIAGAHYLNP